MGLTLGSAGGKTLNTGNLHNYDLRRDQALAVGNWMERVMLKDRACPLSSFSIFTGDINFMADGEQKFKVGRRFVPGTLHRPLPTIFLQT